MKLALLDDEITPAFLAQYEGHNENPKTHTAAN
ncbi:MAG: hypothetical protein ACJA1I_002123 [Zhongshania marina]|jgi:hypothetical protein